MISFNLNKKKAQEIIAYFGKYFDIENSKIDEINSNLEEFSFMTENNSIEEIKDSLITSETRIESIKLNDHLLEKQDSDFEINNLNLDIESKISNNIMSNVIN